MLFVPTSCKQGAISCKIAENWIGLSLFFIVFHVEYLVLWKFLLYAVNVDIEYVWPVCEHRFLTDHRVFSQIVCSVVTEYLPISFLHECTSLANIMAQRETKKLNLQAW